MPQCHRCGADGAADARFCWSCGVALPPPAPEGALPGPAEGAQPAAVGAAPTLPIEVRNVAMLCHLGALAAYVFPLGGVLAPLVIWLMKREESPFVDAHGKESLNWQVSVAIYFLVSLVLALVLVGILLMLALAVANFVLVVRGAIEANSGRHYRYPLTIRFFR